jgi:arabinan endo-1,5-alpha-L-arabinosidase
MLATGALALDGEIRIHDPSTLVQCGSTFYTYGTGGTCLISEDGWSWRRGMTPPRRGMAPDVIRSGDRYLMYVARWISARAFWMLPISRSEGFQSVWARLKTDH